MNKGTRCSRPTELLSIYPTLIDLCGLPKMRALEGASLAPLLMDPKAQWQRPALTTHGKNNHAVRTERYRYIRYYEGSEELYDLQTDPNEWTNLAAKKELAPVKQQLARWIPTVNADPARSAAPRKSKAPRKGAK